MSDSQISVVLSFSLGGTLAPYLVFEAWFQLFNRVAYFKRLRDPGRPALFTVGGKSGWWIFYENVLVHVVRLLRLFMVLRVLTLAGAACMEALESDAEERRREAFVAKMASYEAQVSPSVYAQLVEDLGDPTSSPWRSWDLCAGAASTLSRRPSLHEAPELLNLMLTDRVSPTVLDHSTTVSHC